MELQQLRYVVALAEECNFTRAASKCFVAQSALSHAIKSLETELGIALFSRTSRRVELTAAGAAFLPAARASLSSAERAVADAAATEGIVRGRLSVGAIPTVTAVNVPAALSAFRRTHPQVHVVLQVAGSDELEAAIIRNDVDVAFLGLPPHRQPRGVDSRELGSDELVVVMSPQNRLAHRRRIRLADLASETFADFPSGTPAREESDLAFAAAGVHRHVSFESRATDMTIDLVRQNLAVTLLPCRYVTRFSDVICLPITDGPSRVEYVAWSRFNPSPASQAFLNMQT